MGMRYLRRISSACKPSASDIGNKTDAMNHLGNPVDLRAAETIFAIAHANLFLFIFPRHNLHTDWGTIVNIRTICQRICQPSSLD